MMSRTTVKTRIITLALAGPLVIGAGLCAFVPVIQSSIRGQLEKTMHEDMETSLAGINQGVYDMIATQDQLLRIKLTGDLAVARDTLDREGGITLAADTVEWDAVNQATGARIPVTSPRMMVGDTWLGQNRDPAKPSPVVDKVHELVGAPVRSSSA